MEVKMMVSLGVSFYSRGKEHELSAVVAARGRRRGQVAVDDAERGQGGGGDVCRQ